MHRCLEVEDVVYLILMQCCGQRDRKSVTRLARTCRAFYEPAMDVIWRKLDSLGPLLECMPKTLICDKYVPSLIAASYMEVQAVRFVFVFLYAVTHHDTSISVMNLLWQSGMKCSSTLTAFVSCR